MASFLSGWSELPRELLSSIASRLENRLDVLHLRAVCNSWRDSVPVPPKFPVLPIEFYFLVNHPTKPIACFVISQTTVYRIEPGFETDSHHKTWFIKLEETKENNKFHVLNIFSQHPIKNMPASLPKELNHRNFRVVETARSFSIRQVKEDGEADLSDSNPLIRKIKLASNFDLSYVVAAIKSGHLCRMRVDNDIQWSVLDSDVQYRDIANFEGKFFTVDLHGVILGLHENSFHLEELHSPLEERVWEAERYFVESSGDLYLVIREFFMCPCLVHYDDRIDSFVKESGVEDYHVPVMFRVYKRVPSDHQRIMYEWVQVNDFGDRVFFVSTDCSFSFSARDCNAGCHGNCIIYVNEIDKVERINNEESDEEDNNHHGLKQLRNRKVGLFKLADRSSAPLQVFPQYLSMFWPPPAWLRWSQASSSSS